MGVGVVQIVPALPPSVNGVGDYAYLLANELLVRHGIPTEFLVANAAHQVAGETQAPHSVYTMPKPTEDELVNRLTLLDAETVLLHYVGYAYQKRGCPVWLVSGLGHWLRANPRHRLITMFHELYALGPPWRSSFWTAWPQWMIARSLARASAACLTNRAESAKWLQQFRHADFPRVRCLSVFSNVGEAKDPISLEHRRPRLVVFASPYWAKMCFQYHSELQRFCAKWGVEEIATIGTPRGTAPQIGLPVTELGKLPAAEIGQLLSTSRFGFMDYFPGYLGKSGVFAAYCAFGLVPVLARNGASTGDGCIEGQNYVTVSGVINDDFKNMQTVATKAHSWYTSHNLSFTGRSYAQELNTCTPAT